jgi:cytochrome P450
LAHLDTVIDRFIAEGRRRATPGDDLLSRLLHAQDEDGTRMTDRQLRDEAMTLYLAGHETTALTLTWAWFLLAQHPEDEANLAAEWATVLGGRPPRVEDLPRLPRTERVILESMRLYPPAFAVGREPVGPVELGGYRFGPGTSILMSQWVTHRDPRWFADPEKFRPDRWADGLQQRLPKFAYYPFGGGPRMCIGNTFALMEAALLLATFGPRYRFTLNDPASVELWPAVTLRPRGPVRAVLAGR